MHIGQYKKIIIRMPNWLGDFVMATAVLEEIKRAAPEAEITALCQSPTEELLDHNPFVDKIITFQKGDKKNAIAKLKQQSFDLGILLTNSFSSAWIFWRGKVKKTLGFKGNFRSFLLDISVPFPENREYCHLVETYKSLLKPLGIKSSGANPSLHLSVEEKKAAYARLQQLGIDIQKDHIVGINPGAAYGSAKCWLPERFHEVTKRLTENTQTHVLYFGDQKGAPLVESICKKLPTHVYNLAGKTSIRELIALIFCCHVLLTNDSGPMHIAAALNVPTVALFGSTNPIKTGPYPKGKVIRKPVSCSPCYKRTCPIDFRCMTRISADEVYTELTAGFSLKALIRPSPKQAEEIDPNVLDHLRKTLAEPIENGHQETLTPFTDYDHRGNSNHFTLGKQLIREGKVGCLVIAGGQGTRLGSDSPKGCYPVSVIKQKSLFQLIAEKTYAAGVQAGCELPLAIMTSPSNHKETVKFFTENHYFGLKSEQVTFFQQSELPLLDESGELFLETPDKIAQGPDGNGYTLKHFVEKGPYHQWKEKGVYYLNVITVDNPLADPWDAELIGYQHEHQAEIVVKCTEKKDPHEKVGVLIKRDGKVHVIEYSELSEEEKKATAENGALKHCAANLSLFSGSFPFVERVSTLDLPLHLAHKAAKYLTESGETIRSEGLIAWKFETFIFDNFPFAHSVRALMYPREECFSPLKNKTGSCSPETVKKDLQLRDIQTWESIAKTPAKSHSFELSQAFYYPSEALIKKYRGKPMPVTSYIDF